MSHSLKLINAANQKGIRIIEPKQKSITHLPQQYPQNKVYLQPQIQQSSVKEVNRDKLIEQNQKLKKQVLQLAEQMDEILSKSQKKKHYGVNLEEIFDSQTQIQRLEAKKQQILIVELKNQLFSTKKEIQFVYEESSVIQKQNAIKALQIEAKQLESQKSGLLKVKKEQEKALNSIKNDDIYNEKIEKSKAQVIKLKQECKVLFNKTAQNEKLLLKSHEKTVSKNKKIKEIEQRIKENKQKIKKGNQNVVTIEMISEIEQEIIKLEGQYKDSQKMWVEKINNLDIQYNNRKVEEQKKLIILKDKERQVKLNEIRLKEFKKLILQGRSQKKQESALQNAKQFRNKRNIKYLSKQA